MDAVFWAILLVVLGVIIVCCEVFVPSGGVLAIFSTLCLVGAIWVGFQAGPGTGLLVIASELVIVPLVIAAAFKIWPKTPIGRRVLGTLPTEDEVMPDTEPYRAYRALVGNYGRARTPMRPSGDIVIGGRTYDAISEGAAIEAGESVKVVAVRTNRIVVRRHDGPLPETAAPQDVLAQPIDQIGGDPFEDGMVDTSRADG